MIRILDIALKDIKQLLRDRNVFLFLLAMPIIFTFLFGFAFGGFGGNSDARMPVVFLDEDNSKISRQYHDLLERSELIKLVERRRYNRNDAVNLVVDEEMAAAVIVPEGYGSCMLHGQRSKVLLVGDTSTSSGTTIESEVITTGLHLESAVRLALIFERQVGEQAPFDYIMDETLQKWQDPPIKVVETTSSVIQTQDDKAASMAHTAPGMMLQFAIAGLLTAAQIIVTERKSGVLQRLLTTSTRRLYILSGHFIAICTVLFCQFIILILFGQFVLKVQYLRDPLATLVVAFTAALCIGGLGLLIGMLAKNEEQAVAFALVPMFVFSGLGGAWVPLEVTGPVFRVIGHLSPLAWAMDGFKNISIRGLGVESVLIPAAALLGYAALFLMLSAWRLSKE